MSLLSKNDIKIGHKIKFYRAKHKISQEELADRVDISSKTISNIERNEVVPNLKQILNIAEVFGISLDELFNDVVASKSVSQKKLSSTHLEKINLLTLKLENLQYNELMILEDLISAFIKYRK